MSINNITISKTTFEIIFYSTAKMNVMSSVEICEAKQPLILLQNLLKVEQSVKRIDDRIVIVVKDIWIKKCIITAN
jgi:hypothetical protein